MNAPRPVIYFLTENINPDKERNEIEYLRQIGRVVTVCVGAPASRPPGVKRLSLPEISARAMKLHVLWCKLCYLACRLADSQSDTRFDLRNVYSGNRLVRGLVNLFWKVKVVPAVNRLLPRYDTLYFAPFKAWNSLFGRRRPRRVSRLLVHDALILRLPPFASFIARARLADIPTLGNVKSWDNPYYSQLSTGVDGYLVWSASMWADVQRVHGLGEKFVHVWGARPFYKYSHAVAAFQANAAAQGTRERNGKFNIGYAAAFCDELMGRHEVALVRKLAIELQSAMPEARLFVRPYPILPMAFYADLSACANVVIVGIEGPADVYRDNNKEYEYRMGSDLERCAYLSRCDCFLSIATSFTFEAATFGVPIVHFYRAPESCEDPAEREFFLRLAISDHLVYLFETLPLRTAYPQLIAAFQAIRNGAPPEQFSGAHLLQRIGIPAHPSGWPSRPPRLRQEMLELSDAATRCL